MQTKILIIQQDEAFAMKVYDHLLKDGHDVIDPALTFEDAYQAILNTGANIAVIDASFDTDIVERFSDMLTIMQIPYIINDNQNAILRRRVISHTDMRTHFVDTEQVMLNPYQSAIAHAVWEMHVDRLMVRRAEQNQTNQNAA